MCHGPDFSVHSHVQSPTKALQKASFSEGSFLRAFSVLGSGFLFAPLDLRNAAPKTASPSVCVWLHAPGLHCQLRCCEKTQVGCSNRQNPARNLALDQGFNNYKVVLTLCILRHLREAQVTLHARFPTNSNRQLEWQDH